MATWNQSLFQVIHRLAGRSALLDRAAVFLGDYLAYILVAAFLFWLWRARAWRQKAYFFAEGAIAVLLARGLLTELIRFFYHHARPFDFYNFPPLIAESGWSFPSGHMTLFFALGAVVWYANRRWGYWFLGLSLLMGLARIYAGVHWPLDILGGMAIGLACGAFTHWLFRNERALLGAHRGGAVSAPAGGLGDPA